MPISAISMDIDPLELVKQEDDNNQDDSTLSQADTAALRQDSIALKKEKSKSKLNNYIAITIALTSTFMGVCKIKDDNIVQAMQQSQADRIDDWNWYQARNLREEVANSTLVQLQLQSLSQSPTNRPQYDQQIKFYQDVAQREHQKKEQEKVAAAEAQKKYDELNFHDDQFDLSEAFLSLAISLFAITSLVQKRWLFATALTSAALGSLMGLAGLFSWKLHPDALTKLLSYQPPTYLVAKSMNRQK